MIATHFSHDEIKYFLRGDNKKSTEFCEILGVFLNRTKKKVVEKDIKG
jgi:hypothetical protein